VLLGTAVAAWLVKIVSAARDKDPASFLRRILGARMLDEIILDNFKNRAEVCSYYRQTCFLDYWLLGKFFGDGVMHSILKAQNPAVAMQGGGTRQAVFVALEMPPAAALRVLEVGCGRGYCTHFLAGLFPDTKFHGMDMVECHIQEARRQGMKKNANVSFSVGNILDADEHLGFDMVFGCESLCHLGGCNEHQGFDMVFGCESLCHLDSQESLDKFVGIVASRLLKGNGGRLVVMDGFRKDCTGSLSMCLAESGFRIRQMPSKSDWKDKCSLHGLRLVKDLDLTQEVIPFWEFGSRAARWILLLLFPHPLAVRLALFFKPQRFYSICNLVSMVSIAHCLKQGTAEYGMLVFELAL
jgi:SAM-dependent methyltransferase